MIRRTIAVATGILMAMVATLVVASPSEAATCTNKVSSTYTSNMQSEEFETVARVYYRSCAGGGRKWVAVYALGAGYNRDGQHMSCTDGPHLTHLDITFSFHYNQHNRHVYVACDPDTRRFKRVNVDDEFGNYTNDVGHNDINTYDVNHELHITVRFDPDRWIYNKVMRYS